MTLRTILDGGTFFEGPRWHDGRWWVSDFYRHLVLSFDVEGNDVREEAVVEGQPSGLGWAPDGSLLIVSMRDKRLLKRDAGGALAVLADLSSLAAGLCNDMVVGDDGRAWIGNFGFDYFNGAPPAPATLIRVDPDGTVTAAAEDLMFPNGSVITPDGRTLIVGETFGARYTAFTIGSDGTLSDRRLWAQIDGGVPDGCCLDADGRIWAADPLGRRCILVEAGGRIVETVPAPDDLSVFACMLGGPSETTLLMCCAPDSDPNHRGDAHDAICVTTEVLVPRAGRP